MLIAGGNDNIVEDNYFFDNWRRGTMLLWVPATLRGEAGPGAELRHVRQQPLRRQLHEHAAARTCATPDFSSCQGTSDRNGVDFWWDEEEGQDCDPNQSGCVDTETGERQLLERQHPARTADVPTSDPLARCCRPAPASTPFPSSAQHRQAGVPGAVRDLGPDDEPGSAGLRLVHDAD